jgi:hypothetical protein
MERGRGEGSQSGDVSGLHNRVTDLRIEIVFDAIAFSLRVTTQSQLLKTNEETTVYQSRRSYPVQACDDHEGNGATDV